ncbi:MAG TPA: trypsin-like peptidase domain-containing protein [Pirellulaceae bacterium]|nr:trypsin-like peptidase domain-containing protein [Pirellulaceae bacterium]
MDEFSPVNSPSHESTPPEQPVPREHRIEPVLDATSSGNEGNDDLRVKLAWAKLLWLMLFMAVLLSITYLVPYVIEETQYAARRGRLRADHELAKVELKGSPLAQLSTASQLVTQKVTPSVVHISARTRFADTGPTTMMMGMRSPLYSPPPPGQGSGVIVDGKRGFVITNYHVVRDALEIKVRLAEGKPLRATVVGYDMDSDLAVLQIPPEEMPNQGLTAAEWGDSELLEVGSLVWALGSPYGLELSVTSGIVSARDRGDKVGNPLQHFLQTDAAVNPGNSGGPLVDIHGKVVGINTAIVGENFQGISFAVPSTVARDVYERILVDEEHAVRRGFLGVHPEEMNEERARAAGLDAPQGVYVMEVVPDSPASSIGMLRGDVILSWNGTAVHNPGQLTRVVCATPIKSQAQLIVWRNGKKTELAPTVGERPRHFPGR